MPQAQLYRTLFTLNFFNISASNSKTATEAHFDGRSMQKQDTKIQPVCCKDPLYKKWEQGEIITWLQEFAGISPRQEQTPV